MRATIVLVLAAMMSALPAAAGEWSGYLMDTMCVAKKLGQAASHTAECMRDCRHSGFGLATKEGEYLKFDEQGNAKALRALNETEKKDNLLVTVRGELNQGVLHVDAIRFE